MKGGRAVIERGTLIPDPGSWGEGDKASAFQRERVAVAKACGLEHRPYVETARSGELCPSQSVVLCYRWALGMVLLTAEAGRERTAGTPGRRGAAGETSRTVTRRAHRTALPMTRGDVQTDVRMSISLERERDGRTCGQNSAGVPAVCSVQRQQQQWEPVC